MSNASRTLLPPLPTERTGWGRFKHILREYPTAPLELFVAAVAIVRGIYVTFPGHHEGFPLFPSSQRQAMAHVMVFFGILQWYATLWECGKVRAACSIAMTFIFVYIAAIYVTLAGFWHRPEAAVALFYFCFSLAELWVAFRTPPLIPMRRLSRCCTRRWWRERLRRRRKEASA